MVYDDDVRAREEIVVFSAEDTRRSQEVLSPSDEGKKIIMRKMKKNVVVSGDSYCNNSLTTFHEFVQ